MSVLNECLLYESISHTNRPSKRRSLRVIMIWTTHPETFTSRNQWTIESVLKQHPCATISVYSNTLALEMFKTLVDFGFNVKVLRYDFSKIVAFGEPGYKWTVGNRHADFPYYHVHTSDMLRLLLLFEHGGTYIDMDHVTTGPILGARGPGRNMFGGEECQNDNPDCLKAHDLLQLKVVSAEFVDSPYHLGRAGFHSKNDIDGSPIRYTPCNGVLLNWDAKHPIIAAALKEVDDHYDPYCWGCLGPRLFGKLMSNAAMEVARFSMADNAGRGGFSPLGDVSILPPGILFPVDYTAMASVLGSTRRYDVEMFMARSNSLGIHFYGKMTSSVNIEYGSTMESILREATIFGKVRKQSKVKGGCANMLQD